MSDNYLPNNHLQDSPDNESNNWDVFRSLFLGQPIPTAVDGNINIPAPADNWDTLQQLFELSSPALLPFAQDPLPLVVNNTPVSDSTFSPPLLPQSTPRQSTLWLAQSTCNRSPRAATLIDTIRQHAQMRMSQPSTPLAKPLLWRIAPFSPSVLEKSPPPLSRSDRWRNAARPHITQQNGMKAALVAGILFPYVVLLPTIGLLVGQMRGPNQNPPATLSPPPSLSAPTNPSPHPNRSLQPVVVYLTPTNESEFTDDAPTPIFKPVSLTFQPTQGDNTIKLAIDQASTDGKKLSLSIPAGTAIVIQPTVSQDTQNATAKSHPQLPSQLTLAVP